MHPLRNTTHIPLLMVHLGTHKTALGKAVFNICSAVDFTGEKEAKITRNSSGYQVSVWSICITPTGDPNSIPLMSVTSYFYCFILLNMKINSLL